MNESKGSVVYNMTGKRKDNKGRLLKDNEYQRKDGKYEYKYFFAGHRKSIYSWKLVSTDRVPAGKRDDLSLREKERQIEYDMHDGIDYSSGNITLNKLFEIYMNNKSDLRESTRCNYNALWNNAIRNTALGNMKVTKIKQIHIKSFYAELVKQGLAASTVKAYHNLIYPTLEMAVDSDIIRKNPAKDAKKGIGGTTNERIAITAAEQECFLSFVEHDDHFKIYYPMIVFALNTGLRIGELTGLQWDDIDMKQNIVHIKKQLIYKNLGNGCMFHLQALKTDAGYRDIPLTRLARKSLIKQRELDLLLGKNNKRKEVAGANNYVFINSQGNPFPTNAVNFVLRDIVKAYNEQEAENAARERRECIQLPHISAHILRHSACTRFAESGIDPKVLQTIMGHSNICVTMNVYNHVDTERASKEIRKIDAVI